MADNMGPSKLATAAPLLLGALGPAGLLAGIGGAIFQSGRRKRARREFIDDVQALEFDPSQATEEDIIGEMVEQQQMLGQSQPWLASELARLREEEDERLSREEGLRGEFEASAGFANAVASADQWRTARRLYEDGSPLATTQLARVLEKVIDPTGVVRPGDFELVLASVGMGDRAGDLVRRIVEGGTIPPALAPDIMRAITLITQQRSAQFRENTIPRYRELAGLYDARPEAVVSDPLGALGLEEMLGRLAQPAPPPVPEAEDDPLDPTDNPSLGDRLLDMILPGE